MSSLLSVLVWVFAIGAMFAVGLGSSWSNLMAPWRSIRQVVNVLVTNFVFIPALGWLITQLFPLSVGQRAAILLLAATAGAPFALILGSMARVNVPAIGGLVSGLLIVTVPFLPFALLILLPGARVNPLVVGGQLFITMLAPILLGVWVARVFPRVATRIQPWSRRVSNLAMFIMLGLLPAGNWAAFVSVFSSWVLPACGVLFAGACALGFIFGGESKREHAFAASQRNVAAAMIVAVANFANPEVSNSVMVGSLSGMVVLLPFALIMRNKFPRPSRFRP